MNPLVVDLGTLVERQARRWGDRAFVSFQDGTTLGYAQFGELVARARGALAGLGVGPGDRVALMLKNSLFYPTAWLGVTTLGAVAVPVNSRLGFDDASYIVGHSRARLVLADSETSGVAAETAARADADVEVVEVPTAVHQPDLLAGDRVGPAPASPRTLANVQYTSGTTGFPKGCLLTHGYWQRMGVVAVGLFNLRPDDRVLTAQPFSYIDPLWNVVATLQAGAHLVVCDGFHPSTFMRTVADWKVTVFYCLGVMPTLLLKQPETPRGLTLRKVVCSAIPPELHRTIERRWGAPWVEAFGMTETGINIAVADDDHDELVGSGSIGRALPHCEVSVADESGREVGPGEVGELRLRGLGMMEGYLDDPEATARFFRDGWAHTGDLVSMNERGYIHFRGRRKEMIRRGGENISQAEVEFALRAHEDVLDCAVAPVPDDALGEEGKAYVVLLPARDRDPERLRSFLASRLASFKVPRYWEYRDDLPRTPSERIAKGRLEEDRDWRVDTYDSLSGRWMAT